MGLAGLGMEFFYERDGYEQSDKEGKSNHGVNKLRIFKQTNSTKFKTLEAHYSNTYREYLQKITSPKQDTCYQYIIPQSNKLKFCKI